MHPKNTLFLALASLGMVSSSPMSMTARHEPEVPQGHWIIKHMVRYCNEEDTSCTYKFGINLNDGISNSTACTMDVTTIVSGEGVNNGTITTGSDESENAEGDGDAVEEDNDDTLDEEGKNTTDDDDKKPITRASQSNGGPVNCGDFTVTSGWSGQFGDDEGFTVMSIVHISKQLIIWPAYKDAQLEGGQVVKPDQSYAPQPLP